MSDAATAPRAPGAPPTDRAGGAHGARPAWRRLARVRPTGRGLVLLCAGTLLGVGGVLLELPDVVGLGAAAVLAVAVAWVVLGTQRLDSGRGALDVTRTLAPHPVVRGQSTAVRLEVVARARTGAAYERLARLRLSEQAAHELAGPHGIRARVTAHPDRLAVRYALTPDVRGRWALGPLLTTRTDVFCLVRTTQPLGATTDVAVRPRTVELTSRTRVLGDVDRAATGARLASTDDSVLREYVAGDDPRRVHWAGSARQGRLMVRADESAGVRPVTVLFDPSTLPPPADARSGRPASRGGATAEGERAVELAASIAVSFLTSGRPTRLVAAEDGPVRAPFSAGVRSGRAAVLDQAVDLQGCRTAAEADRALVTTARSLRLTRARAEVTVAVLAPLAEASRRELASLAADGTCWAVVIVPRAPGAAAEADGTLADLRRAGWWATSCTAGTPAAQAWALLTERVA